MKSDKVTPLLNDVDARAAKLRNAGDPISAMELLVADGLRRVRELEARLASPAAFRRAAEQQRREADERDNRRASFSVVDDKDNES